MDMRPSINRANRTRSSISRHCHTARRLWRDDQGANIPSMLDPDRRHASVATNRKQHGQLSILADLISVVEPKSCDAVAQRLLDEWHSIGAVFAAPEQRLRKTAGNAVANLIIHSVRAYSSSLRETVQRHHVSPSDRNLHRYLASAIGRSPVEKMIAILLDAGSRYLTEVTIAYGDVTGVSVNAKHLLRTAVARGAHGIIVAHNHPSGNPQPSESDIANSQVLDAMCRPLGIEVVDHLIVTWNKVASLKSMGAL